ncbi:ParB N-terminal domain-containing protein [Loktanella sp. F6476L]|uniref:ParB N-terminal domain-containing protein n=1 Tax=Loktanella sp. F6476L TaxID=2926405 RepID=UPI001FF6DAAF|nr:ParB N-terminal domain-containing protein [Loktanella sp. F6476L]MCK0122380.1 ParB N-terminal domain-containing protein [Loktanella sp. F6476L]
MARKRKLDATIPEEILTPPVEPEKDRKGSMGGMWAGSAMNMLKQRIEDAHGSLYAGVMAGTVSLELDPAQIVDQVGSDRLSPWQEDEDFAALKANIKRRGQTQPIRVRPVDEDWTPDQANPLKTSDQFMIQSGRRRLEACRALGQPVLAIISTTQGDQGLADLEERFHENTMRRNLNGFEELISIGLLARSLGELTQAEIAARLGVGQGDVSLGLACLEYRQQIMDQVDIATAPKRSYRAMIPKLKRGERVTPLLPKALTGEYTQPYDVRGVRMAAKLGPRGYDISMKQTQIAEADLEPMLGEIAKIVQKYQAKSR